MLGINQCSASNVNDFLSVANLSIKISKGDGHCFLYSIKSGLNDQLGIKLDLADIKSKILTEFTSNKVRYEQFLTSNRNHTHDINNYIHFKAYNTSVCDLLPQITSNSLRINIRIIDQSTNNNSYNDIIIRPPTPTTFTVLLHKKGDHYNALTPIHTSPPTPSVVNTNSSSSNGRRGHGQQTRPVVPPQKPPTRVSTR